MSPPQPSRSLFERSAKPYPGRSAMTKRVPSRSAQRKSTTPRVHPGVREVRASERR